MEQKQMIKLSAVAVIVNGILALSMMSPRPAHAESCSSNNYIAGCGCGWTCAPVSGCTAHKNCFGGVLATCSGAPATYCSYT
jgi:hypothetical protein